jgi:hypothetical protein
VAQNLPNISLEELEAFERELAKMSPEEWEALNSEINNTINSMSEEEREKLFAEAALEAERLEAEFNTLREQQAPIKAKEGILPERSVDQPKKSKDLVNKPQVNESEKNKYAAILLRLSDNLDDLQLLVAEQPLLKTKLMANGQWLKFMNDYHLMHSLVNSIINNDNLQNNLLLSDWDTLRSELVTWDKGLRLIEDIQFSDDDAGISRAEAEMIDKVLGDLFTQHSAENLVWSLKRMFTKYAEDELKNLEKLSKDNKQVYRFPVGRREHTTDTKGVAPKPKTAAPAKSPNIYVHKSASGKVGGKPAAGKDDGVSLGSGQDGAKKDGGTKGGSKDAGKGAKGDKPKKKDSDKEKKDGSDRKKSGDKKNDDKKQIFEDPNKKFINNLKRTVKRANNTVKKIKEQEIADGANPAASLRPHIPELIQIYIGLRDAQVELLSFYDESGKLDSVVADGINDLVGNKDESKVNALTKAAREFSNLKDVYLPAVSSLDVVLSINKDKNFGISDDLKDKDAYKKFIKADIKPHEAQEIETRLLQQPEYLIADIADRLLTFDALADPVKKAINRNQAIGLLGKIRKPE